MSSLGSHTESEGPSTTQGTFGSETDSGVSCERGKDTEKSYSHNGRKTSLCKISYYLVKEGTSWRLRKESPHEKASVHSGCLGLHGPLETRHYLNEKRNRQGCLTSLETR